MSSRTQVLVRWMPALLVAAGIFVGSSFPGPALPRVTLFPGADKVVHLAEYGLLGFFITRALAAGAVAEPAGNLRWLLLTVGAVFLYGLSDEFHQSFVPGRSVDVFDVLADVSGGALGAAIRIATRRRGMKRTLRSNAPP